MGEKVTFASNGHEAHGYLALPDSGSGAGLIVIQEWWGLDDHIVDVTNRLAGEGFVALAPDLFGGKTTHDAETAGKYMQELPVDQAVRDLGGAVDYLLGRSEVTSNKLGVVGFCMGGGFVLQLAAQAGERIAAAVVFYGVVQGEVDLSSVRADVLGHFATNDDFAPPQKAQQMFDDLRQKAGVEATLHIYDGAGHAFFNDENLLGTYNQEYADQAWQRTLEFLRAKVR